MSLPVTLLVSAVYEVEWKMVSVPCSKWKTKKKEAHHCICHWFDFLGPDYWFSPGLEGLLEIGEKRQSHP